MPEGADEEQGGGRRELRDQRLGAIDLESRRLAREARFYLDDVLADIREVESALARFKAWLAVPPEFRRKDRERVA